MNGTPDDQSDDVVYQPGDDGYLDRLLSSDLAFQDPSDPTNAAYLQNLQSGRLVVVSFGAYVDLGYAPPETVRYSPPPGSPLPQFHTGPDIRSQLYPDRVYDTWSLHYENDGVDANGNGVAEPNEYGDQDRDGIFDEGTDGFDNDGVNGVDDPGERETAPPYPYPLRGIQVKIRVFEPDSRSIREVTVVEDFRPK
jgi:hypothetical protein